MADEHLLRLAGDVASLTEPATQALRSELGKRGLEEESTSEHRKVEGPQQIEFAKGAYSQKKYRILWIPAWFIALLLYNLWSQWSHNAGKGSLYIFSAAIEQLTTPLELLLSAAAVYSVLSRSKKQPRDDEVQTMGKRLLWHPAFHTICVLAGTVALLLVVLLVVGSLQGRNTRESRNQAAQSPSPDEKAPVNPNALDNYEIMSQSKADLGSEPMASLRKQRKE
ncbi:MAG: hypothetical protein WDM87_06075 [Terracidiphilus sp.]